MYFSVDHIYLCTMSCGSTHGTLGCMDTWCQDSLTLRRAMQHTRYKYNNGPTPRTLLTGSLLSGDGPSWSEALDGVSTLRSSHSHCTSTLVRRECCRSNLAQPQHETQLNDIAVHKQEL